MFSRQLIVLGDAIPAEMFAWRPNSLPRHGKDVIAEAEVMKWLTSSLVAVKVAHAHLKSADLRRKVKIAYRDATFDGMYLRIIVHANEHMGELVTPA